MEPQDRDGKQDCDATGGGAGSHSFWVVFTGALGVFGAIATVALLLLLLAYLLRDRVHDLRFGRWGHPHTPPMYPTGVGPGM